MLPFDLLNLILFSLLYESVRRYLASGLIELGGMLGCIFFIKNKNNKCRSFFDISLVLT